jgi:Uma2 family endonuclease
MATTTTRLTIDDFERLPDELAENHELVDGELVDVGGNNLEHNLIRDLIGRELALFVRGRGLGIAVSEQEYDFGGNAYGPNVSFFGPAKLPPVDRRKRVQRFVPDLAVEVVSPSNPFDTLMSKKDRYRKCGTAEVWIVSPESREVYVYCEHGDRILREDAELTTELLPGFRILVRQLFEAV